MKQDLRGATIGSIGVGLLMASVSGAGLALGPRGLYTNPAAALGPRPSTSGALVPGFLGHDVFNLFAHASFEQSHQRPDRQRGRAPVCR